jgi:hypothetical protein
MFHIITLFAMCPMIALFLQPAQVPDPHTAAQPPVSNSASTYMPLESWIYPAFERLGVEGYIPTAIFNLRPWTRIYCARLIQEAERQLAIEPITYDAPGIIKSLKEEFAPELAGRSGKHTVDLRLDSVDQRLTAIAGLPLTDGFHFAETLVNDDGRPFAEGANLYSGASVRATAGPFAAYVSAELQRVPTAPTPDAYAQQQIAKADFTSMAAAGPNTGFLRGRLLDAYVSYGISDNQFTIGRQSLWWGPARSGTTLFSNNAEPIDMLRYDRVRPFELPGFLKLLGSIRAQAFVGRLSGTQFVRPSGTLYGTPGSALRDQPFLHGEKFSFRPTENFEFSVSRTVIFGGSGAPVNTATFLRSVFSVSAKNGNNDPGDRRVAFDAQYRIPGLRRCLTGYLDTFSDDQPFPLAYPTESTWISGFFLRCVPQLPRLTLQAEGLISPHRDLAFPGFFYFNVHYLSGYTNNRQLIGSWIGREANGEQLWATWHLSARSSVELSGRSMNVDREFLEGGRLRDLTTTVDIALRPEWQLLVQGQAEWWRFPLLSETPRRDAAFTIQLSYRPLVRMTR